MSYRSSASFGKRIEYVVIGELLRRKYDIYQTLVDDRGIDFILRHESDDSPIYLDIQIKARSKDCLPYDAARFAGLQIDNPRQNYLFIFYSEQLDSYWVFPSLVIVKKAHKLKNGKYHLMLSGRKRDIPYALSKYNEYRNEEGFGIIESTLKSMV